MMGRWGLEGMGSFETERVLRKEMEGRCTPDLHVTPTTAVDIKTPEKNAAPKEDAVAK